ncbi:MAG: hypothetical protein VKJ06_04320 [Vampirovibrionales bacterium]|nr:hypothetical protein [Vampirovibrionales bacterium]
MVRLNLACARRVLWIVVLVVCCVGAKGKAFAGPPQAVCSLKVKAEVFLCNSAGACQTQQRLVLPEYGASALRLRGLVNQGLKLWLSPYGVPYAAQLGLLDAASKASGVAVTDGPDARLHVKLYFFREASALPEAMQRVWQRRPNNAMGLTQRLTETPPNVHTDAQTVVVLILTHHPQTGLPLAPEQLATVINHELGHALGIVNHLQEPEALMAAQFSLLRLGNALPGTVFTGFKKEPTRHDFDEIERVLVKYNCNSL